MWARYGLPVHDTVQHTRTQNCAAHQYVVWCGTAVPRGTVMHTSTRYTNTWHGNFLPVHTGSTYWQAHAGRGGRQKHHNQRYRCVKSSLFWLLANSRDAQTKPENIRYKNIFGRRFSRRIWAFFFPILFIFKYMEAYKNRYRVSTKPNPDNPKPYATKKYHPVPQQKNVFVHLTFNPNSPTFRDICFFLRLLTIEVHFLCE